MSNSQYAVTDEAVDALTTFMAEIFDRHFIKDMGVRKTVARSLLADSQLLDTVTEKYDLQNVLNNSGVRTGNLEGLDAPRPVVSIKVSLTAAQREILVRNNMDFSITFKDGVPAPHALAYAQRVVDTVRCKSQVSYRQGTVIDFGGNYATHAMNGALKIHSCTLLDSVEEQHRQTQRDTHLELGGFDEPSKCVVGIENCDIFATEAFSLHTLPRLDPSLVLHVFQQHGLEYMTGVHHFDPDMFVSDRGYMKDVECHWVVDREDNVEFYFDNDSSYSYKHRLDWLKFYGQQQCFTNAYYSFVVYYTVTRMEHGMVYWDMIRLDKDTLGPQTINPQYILSEDADVVILDVPVFQQGTGYAVTDPRSYKNEKVSCPASLFAHVYQAAISNDSPRPDLPMTLDFVRDMVCTFQYSRKVNGMHITQDCRLPTIQAEKVATGIYLVAVQKVAQMRLAATEYTRSFQRIQNRWGEEAYLFLLVKCFSWTAILPFVLLADGVGGVVDLVSAHMRAVAKAYKVTALAIDKLPYTSVSPAYRINATPYKYFQKKDVKDITEVNLENVEVDLETFHEVFKDELAPEHEIFLRDKINAQKAKDANKISDALNASALPDVDESRESWDEAMAHVAQALPSIEASDPRIATREQIFKDTRLRIYEAGLYNFDVALNVLATAKNRCSETWTGTGYKDAKITSANNTSDVGIRYLKVVNKKILENQGANQYMVALDPNTHELLYMPDEGSDMLVNTQSEYIFVFDAFKIFLGFKKGRKLVKYAQFMNEPRGYKLTLVDGVPGCGKTHEIVEKFTPEDLIVCATRATADDTRERIKKKYPTIPNTRIKTVDSGVLNTLPKANRVYVDEGLLAEPGCLDYIGQVTKCEHMEVFGDSAQIGFIDRGSKLGVLRFVKLVNWEALELRNVTNRLPADAICLIRRFYPADRRHLIRTTSSVKRSIRAFHITNLDDVKYTVPEPNTISLSIRQADRDFLLKNSGYVYAKRVQENPALAKNKSTAMTVHEAQGKDVQHATFYRTNTWQDPIYESSFHLLVGFSRHQSSLHVVSCNASDACTMLRMAEEAERFTDEELEDCMEQTPVWLQDKIDKFLPRGSILS